MAFIIQWILFLPAYFFQTEKFYDIVGSFTYLTVILFTFFSSNISIGFNIGNLITSFLIIIWAFRLGSFLFLRICKEGEDKRFKFIKPSATRFLMTWISPIFTYLLLVYVSGVRILEASGEKRWGHLKSYQEYLKNTPSLLI